MCEDLKEIISHLNTSAQAQDSRDPVHQIGKVRGGGRWWWTVTPCPRC